MASIEKIQNKTGVSYRITVSTGYGSDGKKLRRHLKWTPEPGMTARQTEKALARAAADFERSVEQGFCPDDKQTFSQYCRYVIDLKQQGGVKVRTLDGYRALLPRIDKAIGHLKLADIRPQHLNSFYKNLGEDGVRADNASASAKVDFRDFLKKNGLTQKALAEKAGISAATVSVLCSGNHIRLDKAEAIAKALGVPVAKLFDVIRDTSPLSNKTVTEYHRFISTVLTQAEKEMLVQFNAASKATPPKQKKGNPKYLQPDELYDVLDALASEPLKWRCIVYLLITTGCRRGEIMGLKWSKVDLNTGRIVIDEALLKSPSIVGVYVDTTKTSDIRYLNLPAETVALLQEHRTAQIALRLANGDRWVNSDFVFTRDDGRQMNPDSVTGWLGRFSERHGLPHLHPHMFRHTAASILIAEGVDVVTVAGQLGHSNATTTETIYSHLIDESKARASEVIADKLLRRKKDKKIEGAS